MNVPINASEWPYPQYLIHRYPSRTEWCDYENIGALSLSSPESGECIRAIYLTYAYSRLLQIRGRAEARSDAPSPEESQEYYSANNASFSQRGCIRAEELENISILLRDVTKHSFVGKTTASISISGSYNDNQSLSDAERNAPEELNRQLLEGTRETTEWAAPHFHTGDCITASDINKLVVRANSLCYYWDITTIIGYNNTILAEVSQNKIIQTHSLCASKNFVIDNQEGCLSIGSAHECEDGSTVPSGEGAFSEFFGGTHGYMVSLSRVAPSGVQESYHVKLMMVFSLEKYKTTSSRGRQTKNIHTNEECHDFIHDEHGTRKTDEDEWEVIGSSEAIERKIFTVTLEGNTTEIDGVHYAIPSSNLIDELKGYWSDLVLSNLDLVVTHSFSIEADGFCAHEEKLDCCEDEFYCPDGCEAQQCVAYGEPYDENADCEICTKSNTLRWQKYTSGYNYERQEGVGVYNIYARIRELSSCVEFQPTFLSL